MSKGGSKTQTVRNTTEIPAFLQPFVQRQAEIGTGALEEFQSRLQNAGAEELVSPFTQDQLSAFDIARNTAMGQGGFIPAAQQEFLATAQGRNPGDFIDPAAFDALQSSARGDFLFGGEGFDQAVDAAVRQALPQVASVFGGSGRGTGGLAQAAIGEAATDAFARMFGQERQRQMGAASALSSLADSERKRQLLAAGQLPGIAFAPSDALFNIGGMQQSQAQRELTAPLTAQESLLSASGGGVPLQSLLGSSQSQPLHRNSMAGILGGASAGAGIASAMSLSNPWTAALALGGGLLGGMG